MTSRFVQRVQARGLTRWQLADLLGVHPHQLVDPEVHAGLADLPVRVIVELARLTDLHPADLVPDLDTVLGNRRLNPPAPTTGTPVDALTLLTALATAGIPLTTDQLAETLSWTLDRVAAAIDDITAQPALGGPLALRRHAPATYAITPRLDRLTEQQRQAVLATPAATASITIDQANELLAEITTNTPQPDRRDSGGATDM